MAKERPTAWNSILQIFTYLIRGEQKCCYDIDIRTGLETGVEFTPSLVTIRPIRKRRYYALYTSALLADRDSYRYSDRVMAAVTVPVTCKAIMMNDIARCMCVIV